MMEIKGECRQENIKVDWEYVINKYGGDGLKKLEDKMTEIGYPLKYKEIKPMNFCPIGLETISMLAIRDVFRLDDKDLEEMGAEATKFSLLMRVFFKYFVSLQMVADEIPKMWLKHYTLGNVEMPEYNVDKKYVVLRVKDFNVHPIFCIVFKGYFSKVAEMVIKSRVITEEVKCTFKGGEYHEYLIKW